MAGEGRQLFFRQGAHTTEVTGPVGKVVLIAIVVEQFAGTRHGVALRLKVIRVGRNASGDRRLEDVRVEEVDSGCARVHRDTHAGAGRVADGCLTMRVVETHPTRGEAVDVRSQCLRMPVEVLDPVIEVVDGNNEDVGRSGFSGRGKDRKKGEGK